MMNWSWFGPRSNDGYGSGIAAWQGFAVTALFLGGLIAAINWLPHLWALAASAGLLILFLVIVRLTYDKDAIT
jgi:hypothetical protein